MIFFEAQREFQIRHYLWSISEFEDEIEKSFPNLKLYKAGRVWEIYQFMQLLGRNEQLTLAHSLLKRRHSDAVKTLGESMSDEEKSLLSKCDSFFQIKKQYNHIQRLEGSGQKEFARIAFNRCVLPYSATILGESDVADKKTLRSQFDDIFHGVPATFEEMLSARKRNGEKIKFASKRKLQKAITERFRAAFAGQITDHTYDDLLDLSSNFSMKCCGWNLSTHFWFGRRESQINYSHSLASPTTYEHHGNHIPTMVMDHSISWLSMNHWEYIDEKEVDPSCDDVIKLCSRFIDVAPKLLKGLEFDKITP